MERHCHPQDFAQRGPPAKMNEIQIHTWPDATLAEIAGLVKSLDGPEGVLASAHGACMSFATVFPDRDGCFQIREVGRVVTAPTPVDSEAPTTVTPTQCTAPTDDGARSLASLRFIAGDYLDIAIIAGLQYHDKGSKGWGGKGFKGGGGKAGGKGGDGGGWENREMGKGEDKTRD